MMRKRSPYGGGGQHRHNNNNRGGGGQVRRHHRRDNNGNTNTQYEQQDDEFVSPRLRRHAQIQREKYVNMAIDARRSGDRVQAEYWLQHADHYQRILNVAQEQFASRGPSGEEGDDNQHSNNQMNDDSQSNPSYQSGPQQQQNDGYAQESSAEDDAYEPSYGTPAPQQERPRRQQNQSGGQRRQHNPRHQRSSEPRHQSQDAAGGLEDVLPMPKPESSRNDFGGDEE